MKTSIFIALMIWACYWLGLPQYVQPGRTGVCSEQVKRTIKFMGPGKTYRLLPNNTLKVLVDGQWLNLKLRKEK